MPSDFASDNNGMHKLKSLRLRDYDQRGNGVVHLPLLVWRAAIDNQKHKALSPRRWQHLEGLSEMNA